MVARSEQVERLRGVKRAGGPVVIPWKVERRGSQPNFLHEQTSCASRDLFSRAER